MEVLLKTADQYYKAVQRIDQDRIDQEIDRIPLNVNRAGKHYRKLIKEIRERYENKNRD